MTFKIYIRTEPGPTYVHAETSRQAVAILVARKKLTEDQARRVTTWAVKKLEEGEQL